MRFWGGTPSQMMQLQIAVKPSVLIWHLANTKSTLRVLALAISLFAKILWSLLLSSLYHHQRRHCLLLLYLLLLLSFVLRVFNQCLLS